MRVFGQYILHNYAFQISLIKIVIRLRDIGCQDSEVSLRLKICFDFKVGEIFAIIQDEILFFIFIFSN